MFTRVMTICSTISGGFREKSIELRSGPGYQWFHGVSAGIPSGFRRQKKTLFIQFDRRKFLESIIAAFKRPRNLADHNEFIGKIQYNPLPF